MRKFYFKSAVLGFVIAAIGITTVFAAEEIKSAACSNAKITLDGVSTPLSNSLNELAEYLRYNVNWVNGANSEFPAEIENANFLTIVGNTQYYWTLEGDNCVLYGLDKNESTANQLAIFPPHRDVGRDPTPNSIVEFGVCDNWIIASVGHYEGSGHYFYGDFVRMKKDGTNLEHFWLTDDDRFTIVDNWIYYNFWTVKGSSDEGCYRIHPDGTGKEYMGDILHSIFLYDQDGYVYGEHDTGKTIDNINPMTDLIRCKPDGSELTTLFSGDSLPKMENSNYMRYYNIKTDNDYVTFTVAVHGYSEGDSWGGHYNYIANYRVNKDGSNLVLLHEEYN